MCLNPGDILCDRYLIDRELGRGGFGVTYLARDLETPDLWVVVKEIPQPQSEDALVLQQARVLFEREVEVLKTLGTHPQIPQLFNSFEKRGNFYLIQEYIEGHPLKNELTSDLPWSEAQTLALLEEILEILEFVHQDRVVYQEGVPYLKVVVHGDIHPGNLIRRSSDGKIVLIDFGAIKEIGTLEIADSCGMTTHPIDTPDYRPPEQARGPIGEIEPSSDIYAVGCICVQALTGLHPGQFQSQFRRDTAGNLMLQGLSISPKILEILQTMVRDRFNERYSGATEALEAVRKLNILRDRYLIDRELGRGGFGVTYLARDLETPDFWVVVKRIPQPQSEDARVLQRARVLFDREVKALKKLGMHPQIPQLFDSFEEGGNFYLIQEYIEGHPLSTEFTSDLPWSEAQTLAFLQEILEILEVVHKNEVVHRDIHPGNLIRRSSDGKIALIDFGAVREIGTLEIADSSEMTTHPIGTPGYMPPEQTRGLTKPSSDIYAVGCICVQALTGLHPGQFQSQFRRDTAGNLMLQGLSISPKFLEILQTMVRYHFNDRYPGATEALEAVRRLKKPWWCHIDSRWLLGLGIVLGGGAMVFALLRFLRPPTCSATLNDYLSCGEEILVGGNPISSKKDGVEAFARKDYETAIELFEAAREEQRNDPETLIYLNNAELAAKGDLVYTIAVAVPLERPANRQNAGLEILRGIAQAQAEINKRQEYSGWGLRVVIADDDNDGKQARDIAEKLGKRSEILAVVGHSTSSLVKETLTIYERYKLVSISPNSTSDELNRGDYLSPFLFRTSAEEAANTQKLAEHLLDTDISKVAVFYNPNATASNALFENFSFQFGKTRLVNPNFDSDFDLSDANFNADTAIDKAIQQGATGLLLFPDAKVDPHAFNNTLEVLKTNRNRYWSGGGTSLYASDFLKLGEAAKGLVVAVPWHHLKSPDLEFTSKTEQLWGGRVSWRTAMAYDATIALATALENQSSPNPLAAVRAYLTPQIRRVRLQKTLADPDFSATGATGTIQFDETGDRRNPSVELVQVLPCANERYRFTFVPIEFPTATDAGLTCYRSTFSQVSGVPNGSFFYGGSTVWAKIRDRVDLIIQKAQPEFGQRYLPPANGIAPSSGQGISMLIDDRLDIAQSSRQIKDEEHDRAQQRGFRLREIPISIDGVAVAVNPSLNVPGLTVTQFCNIYVGKITNWSQVGGPNLKIQPYLKPNQENPFCQSIDPSFAQEVATTTIALNQVNKNPGGIFWSSASLLVEQCTVKLLPIGNKPNEWVSMYREPFVPPERCPEERNRVNADAIRSGEYPLTRRLRVIIKENGQAAQQAGEAYGNLLLTDEGQEMLEAAGFIRLK